MIDYVCFLGYNKREVIIMTFGERLDKCIKESSYTQKELAEVIGITPVRLNYWVKDKRQPDVQFIRALANALNVSADYLIGNDCAEYSRENYNGLNAEEARQFAQGVSNEAMRIALLYDSLDDHGQEILNAIASIEFSRLELANAAQGIAELDRIGAKRLGSFAGLPHYEMGNPSVSSAKYFARAERAELEKEETVHTET
jgi:transcriptional regulator with XRE-family HTH domain